MGGEAKLKLQVAPAHPGASDRAATVGQSGQGLGRARHADTGQRLDSQDDVEPAQAGTFKLRAVWRPMRRTSPATAPSSACGCSTRATPTACPTGPAHYIVVDRSQYKLYYMEHGILKKVFDCVLGRPSLPTPLGHFHIYAKDPHMGGPYGPRRMRYLGDYAIHGTDEPWLLDRFPRNYSHGCTRLSNAHILWLFSRVPVGTPVWNVP